MNVDDSTSLSKVAISGVAQRPVSGPERSRNTQEPTSQAVASDLPSGPTISVAEAATQVNEEKQRSLGELRSVTDSIEEAVEFLNEALSKKLTSASIRRDEELNRYLVTIKDKKSGDVVREIPDEALLKFARNLEELKGILFDQTL
tara:strand:+ start:269 stop:706 length:438 start_codon:yes stop_codon:yes gene_type:complete